MTLRSTKAKSIRFDIYIGGNYHDAQRICREFCTEIGFCVTVEKLEYIYTEGQESGVRIGIFNYPRFPKEEQELYARAVELANMLLLGLFQSSYSIEGPEETVWRSRRPD